MKLLALLQLFLSCHHQSFPWVPFQLFTSSWEQVNILLRAAYLTRFISAIFARSKRSNYLLTQSNAFWFTFQYFCLYYTISLSLESGVCQYLKIRQTRCLILCYISVIYVLHMWSCVYICVPFILDKQKIYFFVH